MFNQKEYIKKWRLDNQEKILKKRRNRYKENIEKEKECSKRYYENNKEKIIEKVKQYYQNNSKKIKEYSKRWAKNNPEKTRAYSRKWEKVKRKTDLRFNLNHRTSSEIYKSLKGDKAGKHWEDLVGYTLSELIKRLKKTIPKDYIWQDYLEGKLHIDHIIPISAHNFTKPENPDFRRCWALSNLRLLPAKENLIKGSKLTEPFQPALKILQ